MRTLKSLISVRISRKAWSKKFNPYVLCGLSIGTLFFLTLAVNKMNIVRNFFIQLSSFSRGIFLIASIVALLFYKITEIVRAL